MLSPYLNSDFFLEVYVTNRATKVSERLVFSEEEFAEFVDFLENMFPPEKENELFSFNCEKISFDIKEIKNA
jgi:hypothetical protein